MQAKERKKYLPISIDITNEKILIIGAGESAYNKAMILRRFDADIEFVALDVCKQIQDSEWLYTQKPYEPKDLDGYLMVYSCSNNPELDKQIVEDAKERRVLVNIHDKTALCQYISPAVYQFRNMMVAVTSSGEDVLQSIKLRNHLREYLNENIESIVEFEESKE